ncbi:MAG: hypothetical protein JW881_17595 [Spirochaetales bacterium]|nr:hypothetical protein [Spirochaetales bacterium]
MRYFIIFNPGSRNGRARGQLHRIKHFFSSHNLPYHLAVTLNLDHALRLSTSANRFGYDVIIASGGDGTINSVLNGFYDNNGKRLSRAKMGIIYTGTSPDFCKSYHIPYRRIDDALQVILQGKTTHIQIGKIKLATSFVGGKTRVEKDDPDFTTRYFGCCVNVGLGAELARYANSGIRKICGDTIGTFLSLLKTLSSYNPSAYTIHRDGKPVEISNLYNLSIGKTYHIASGIKVHSCLEEGDGRFYNLLVRDVNPRNFPLCMKSIYSGRPIENSNAVSLEYTKEIEIESPGRACEVEFDGDPRGYLPCHIEMAEDMLDLITEENYGR